MSQRDEKTPFAEFLYSQFVSLCILFHVTYRLSLTTHPSDRPAINGTIVFPSVISYAVGTNSPLTALFSVTVRLIRGS